MGSILGCRKAALAMAAGMSIGRSPFLRIDTNHRRGNNEDEKTSIEDMKNERILEERKALMTKVGNSDHSLLGTLLYFSCVSLFKDSIFRIHLTLSSTSSTPKLLFTCNGNRLAQAEEKENEFATLLALVLMACGICCN